jgi:hypothetical protein
LYFLQKTTDISSTMSAGMLPDIESQGGERIAIAKPKINLLSADNGSTGFESLDWSPSHTDGLERSVQLASILAQRLVHRWGQCHPYSDATTHFKQPLPMDHPNLPGYFAVEMQFEMNIEEIQGLASLVLNRCVIRIYSCAGK